MTTLLSGVLTLALLSLEATEKWSETDKQLLKEVTKKSTNSKKSKGFFKLTLILIQYTHFIVGP